MYASVVLVQHRRRAAVRALRAARAVAAEVSSEAEIALSRAAQALRLRADTRPPHVPGRVLVMSFARSTDVLDHADARVTRQLGDGASEIWRALLEPVRVHGDWFGFTPDVDGVAPLDPDEPVVVMINGVLRLRFLPKFTLDNARIGKHLTTAAGYVGGFGFSDTPLTTTSFSCWSNSRHSRAFAFRDGHHPRAYKTDLAEGRHSTEFFVRFRPLRSEGTIDGVDPLAADHALPRTGPPR